MTKYNSLREAAGKQCRQYIEEQKGTGWWLRERSVQFDNSYKLKGKSLAQVEEIVNVCSVPKRKDTLHKLVTIIANLLRYRDRRPVEIALKIIESKKSPLIKKLEECGFLNVRRGNEMIARYSKIWPTEKLLAHFEKVHSPDIVVDPPLSELVILKDEGGNPKAYKDNARTSRIKKILAKANEVNRKSEIMCGKLPVSTALVAIFHKKFTLYGRLHTKGCYHYQGFSSDMRSNITINGEKVVELDFSGLHPHLLYASEGVQLDIDPYSIIPDAPKFIRDFLKMCLLPLLNAKCGKVPGLWVEPKKRNRYYRKAYLRAAACNAEGGINQRIGGNQKCRDWLKKNGITKACQLIELFKEFHAPIAGHFCADNENGLRVMNKDASIALDVVEHFSNKSVPILSIHDSFIVQDQYREELYNVMDQTYKKHSGGFVCPIK